MFYKKFFGLAFGASLYCVASSASWAFDADSLRFNSKPIDWDGAYVGGEIGGALLNVMGGRYWSSGDHKIIYSAEAAVGTSLGINSRLQLGGNATIGYPVGDLLPYVSTGASLILGGGFGVSPLGRVGGGVATVLNEKLLVKLEYNLNLGSYLIPGAGLTTFNSVTLSMAYKW